MTPPSTLRVVFALTAVLGAAAACGGGHGDTCLQLCKGDSVDCPSYLGYTCRGCD